MPFEPGRSGNPSGRPKKTDEQRRFEEQCRTYLDKKGWSSLQKMARSKNPRERMWALETILDRGYGKPGQSLDITLSAEDLAYLRQLREMSDEELDEHDRQRGIPAAGAQAPEAV